MMRFLAGIIAGIVLALALGNAPVESVDVPGRSQAWVALQSSVVLVSYGGTPPRIIGAYCGGTKVDERLVLTAFHCVRRDDGPYYVEAYVQRGTALSASVVWRRQGADLALLQTTTPIPGKVAQLAPDLAVGEDIVLVGAPNSGTESVPFMLTRGAVGQIRVMNFDDSKSPCEKKYPFGQEDHQVILTDAAAYYGNSGGGAFNLFGQLIGVLVRGESATMLGKECDDYAGEHIVWSYLVGLEELRKIPKP